MQVLCLFTKSFLKMWQEIIVWIVFILALAYLANMLYQHFSPKSNSGCAKGCGSCSSSDIRKIEEQLRKIKH